MRARAPDQESHNKNEADEFDKLVDVFLEPLPELILDKLKRISSFAPNLGPDSRVLDIGSGTGVLIPHLQVNSVKPCLKGNLQWCMSLASVWFQVADVRLPDDWQNLILVCTSSHDHVTSESAILRLRIDE